MAVQTFEAGHWLITEGGVPSYFMHKLMSGTVGIYEDGQKIAEVEVNDGGRPRWLGFVSTLGKNHHHRASVRTETEVAVDSVYVDHIQGLLRHEVPVDIREDIDLMVEAVSMADHIKGLRRKLAKMKMVDLIPPSDIDKELADVLAELKRLYESLMQDEECRDQTV